MYTSFFKRERQYDPFRVKENMNRRILPQQTSQIYMYTLFFMRERQHDPFRAKEIINREILQQQTSQIYMHSSFFKRERQYDPFKGFCPGVRVHKEITIVLSLFRSHWLAVVYCLVLCSGSCEPVHEDRSV